MRLRIFTFLVAFLAIAGNAVWGQGNEPITIDVSGTSNIGTSGSGNYYFEYDNENDYRKLTIYQSGDYTIKGDPKIVADGNNNTNVQIVIATAGTYNITLDNVRSDANLGNDLDGSDTSGEAKYPDRCAFQIGDDSNAEVIVNLEWTGYNKFWSGRERAGINVKPGATLILNGPDEDANSLEAGSFNNSAQVFTYGAGIGGDKIKPSFGTIIINSGKISAYSQDKSDKNRMAMGAGIGGGSDGTDGSTQGSIYINGGNVTAECQDFYGNSIERGAGIGGGYNGTCDRIIIIGKETTSVIASSATGADIGVGFSYSGYDEPEIIIGNWDDEAKVSVKAEDITTTNFVDGLKLKGSYSASGTVTMPDDYQIYIPGEVSNPENFHAYNVKLNANMLSGENHKITSNTNYENRKFYYYGANMSFTEDPLTCNEDHLFLGWYDSENNKAVPVISSTATFKDIFSSPLTNHVVYEYSAVWVEDERTLIVESGTEWKDETGSDAPAIRYTPADDVLKDLNFSIITTNPLPEELTGLTFGSTNKNLLVGTPTLVNGETIAECEIGATVKLTDNGDAENIDITIIIVTDLTINEVDVKTPHIYNGLPHNPGRNDDGIPSDYVLEVKMTEDNGVAMSEPRILTEGYHYRIYSYNVTGVEEVQKAEDGKTASIPIIDAGVYSNITLEALKATLSEELDPDMTGQYTLPEGKTVTVAQRPLTISFSLDKTPLEVGEDPTKEMVTVLKEGFDPTMNRGLVEGEEPNISYEIGFRYNTEQTECTVFITNIVVKDNLEKGFKKSNYNITINDEEGYLYRLPGEKEEGDGEYKPFPGGGESDEEGVEIGTIPVISTPSTGGGTKKKYQLYLANKDYLETGETPVYYEKEGLELFSRHNKKYTYAGGSFTIWYEKDGVPNDGNYRIFWSKSANGEYKEVKFDDVSEYYQIRDVYSNVYVKIFYENGFPVANEEISATDARAYAQANKIVVITPEPTNVQIISMTGAVVATDQVTGQREFANLMEGIYIVRMGDTVVKLQVRN